MVSLSFGCNKHGQLGTGSTKNEVELSPVRRLVSDVMKTICLSTGINGSAPVVLNYVGANCGTMKVSGADLNMPSITIASLNQTQTILRTVTNIGGNESYSLGWNAPYVVSMKVSPTRFFIASGKKQVLSVSLNSTLKCSAASFGRIRLFGDKSHVVNIHLSVSG